jgi:hypothetical protein
MLSFRLRTTLWAAGVGVAALLPLILAGALSPARTLAWRDSALLYAPLRPLVVEALRAGRLPLWNPYEGTGQPLFAQAMHAVLHPASLLLAPFTSSIDAWLLMLVAFAAVGAFTAARSLGASAPASAAAAGAYALSGYVLAMIANVPYLAGAATLPWVAAAMRAAAVPARAPPLLATAAVAAMAFSGDFQALAAAVIIGAALAAEAGGLRAVGRAMVGAALGLAVAAVQLLPSAAFLHHTARTVAMAGDERRWPLDPWRLLELVFPGFFSGRPEAFEAPVFLALGTPSGAHFPFSASVFVGSAVLLLAVAGARAQRAGRWLAALALLFLWLALGHHLGAQQLLDWIPIWGKFRYAEKLVAPLTLCLSLGAALGVDGAARAPGRRMALATIGAGALTAALAAVAAAPGILERFFVERGADPGTAALARLHLATGASHAAGALGALGAALLVARRRPIPLAGILAVLVWGEGWAATPFALHVGSAAALSAPPPSGLRADPPGPRFVTPIEHPVSSMPGLDTIDRTQLLTSRVGLPSTNARARLDNVEGYTGLMTLRTAVILGSGPNLWTLLRRFGATHLVATYPRNAAEEDALRVASEGAVRVAGPDADGLSIWEIPHRPWASFATSARAVRSLRAAAVAIQDQARRGGSDVIVETGAAVPVAPGYVLRVRRGVEEVEIEAKAEGDGLLVVNDAWDPGWRAEIDGEPAKVLPADVLVRAVRWPAGRHRLCMRYDPPEVALGAAVSGAALAAALLVLLWSRLRPLHPLM